MGAQIRFRTIGRTIAHEEERRQRTVELFRLPLVIGEHPRSAIGGSDPGWRRGGYREGEIDLIDTRAFWHDLEQRSRIIKVLRDRGGQLLNEEVTWKTKQGQLIHLFISCVQVAYQGGHISFVGGKRICWVYDVGRIQSISTKRC